MSIPQTQPLKKFVRAGAGAGKTYNLTREVIRFAEDYHLQHQKWPRVVLTTFTRKATQELKERMLIYCLQEKQTALEFVQSSSFLTVTTMHGLLSLFLKRYGHGLGLSSSFKIIEANKSDFWRKQILKDMIASQDYPKSLERFEISKVLKHLKSFEKVFWHGQFRPAEVDDLETLIKENCKQLADDISKLVSQGESEVQGDQWPRYFDYLRDTVTVLITDHPWKLKREFLRSIESVKKPVKSKKNSPLTEDTADALKKCLDKVKQYSEDEAYDPDLWMGSVELLKDFDQFSKSFLTLLAQKKIDEASLEPDDLEFFSLSLQQKRQDLTDQFASDFEAWFIDEFQDTSPLQIKLLNQFMKNQSSYLVGDPQQSIYLFRGSRSEVFFDKNKEMIEQGAEVIELIDNYRSTDHLLEFINHFFEFRGSHFSKMKPTIKNQSQLKPVVMTHVLNKGKEFESALLSQQISELLKSGVSPKDICILTRTHTDLEFLEKNLSRLGFPVLSHSSSQFYKRREILDAISLLTLLINPWDDHNLIMLMRSPWLGLSDALILEIIGENKKNYWPLFKKYFSTLSKDTAGQYLLEAFELKEFYGIGWVFRKSLLRLGLLDYTHRIDPTGRREANLWKLINLVEKTSREPGGSLLELARSGAQSFELEDLGDSGDASAPVEPNKINLMTIHASKGLQFSYVFIPFLHKKPQETTYQDFCSIDKKSLWSMRLPLGVKGQFIGSVFEEHYKTEMQTRESEESERVLYVAMTRAKEGLYLSWTGEPEKRSWGLMIDQFNFNHKNHARVEFSSINDCEEVTYNDDSIKTIIREPSLTPLNRFRLSDKRPVKSQEFIKDFESLEKREAQRQKGVLLHRLFETLKDHSEERVKNLALLWLPQHQEDVLKGLDYVTHHPEIPLLEIIRAGEVEWAYQIEDADSVKEGRIDLWGIYNDCLWIVDYKTGSPSHVDRAREQLNDYESALRKLLNWDKEVKKVALYPFSQKTFVN